jgi:hypothetical protein
MTESKRKKNKSCNTFRPLVSSGCVPMDDARGDDGGGPGGEDIRGCDAEGLGGRMKNNGLQRNNKKVGRKSGEGT